MAKKSIPPTSSTSFDLKQQIPGTNAKYPNPKDSAEKTYNLGWDDADKGILPENCGLKPGILYDWWECGWSDNPKSKDLIPE